MLKLFGVLTIEALLLSILYLLGSFVAWDFDPSTWTNVLRFVVGAFAVYLTVQVLNASSET